MPKTNIRDNLNGNELDLSLSNLTVVPVQEIAAIPKVTHLDLSNNSLISIPSQLCDLTRLVKLDLSQNQLTSLPSNIGQLEKLKHLDLYSNQLTTLPVSMCQLKSLKWLDVKNNPLGETLQRVAGECLETAQCQKCARNVVAFMKKVEIEQERQRQIALENQRAEEAAQLAKEEEARRKIREKKKREKEKRRLQLEAQKEAERQAKAAMETRPQIVEESKSNGKHQVKERKKRAGLGCWGMLLSALLGVLALILTVCVCCNFHPTDTFCMEAKLRFNHFLQAATRLVKDIAVQSNSLLCQAAQFIVLWLGVVKEKLTPYCEVAFEFILQFYVVASKNCLHLYDVSKEWAVHCFELAKSKLQ